MSHMRSKVLASFKNLHKARKAVFSGDGAALTAGRQKINEEFQKNKNEVDPEKIETFIKVADETAEYLRTSVLQAEYNPDRNAYQVKITKDTVLNDNVPFDENWEPSKRSRRKEGPCSST